jgi:tetratricopeptide (TPR) repeat protein
MKTTTFLFSLVITALVAGPVIANDTRYLEAMQKNIQSVYKAKSIDELQTAANSLDRIATAEKAKWEPYYYMSFAYILMANMEQEAAKKDAYLDQANTAIEKALSVNPNESEIIALVGFMHMIRLTVDPASRGAQYSDLAMQAFGKASGLNPENPRALALMASMQHGTAKFFGSPITEACATLESALQKFDSYKSENPLAPQWGREMALGLKKECK